MAESSEKIGEINKVFEDFKKMIVDAKFSQNMGEFLKLTLE